MTDALKRMSAEELEQHKTDVLNEIEWRAALSQIPHQVSRLAAQYRAAGGSADDVTEAVRQGYGDVQH